MLCLRPGPAEVRILTTAGVPPIRWEPRPAPAWPLTMSCLVSASNHMVVLRASSSSVVSQSFARSQIQGGSVTWASQSKVRKSLVIGANFWMGMRHLLFVLLSRFHGELEYIRNSQHRQSQAGAGFAQKPGESRHSFLQVHLDLAALRVKRARDVRMEKFPLAFNLLPAIGHPEGSLAGFTVLIRPGEMLNAVGDPYLPVSDDTEGDKVPLDVLGATEKLLKIRAHRLRAHKLQRNNIVVEHDLLLVLKGHRFVCASRGDQFVLEGSNLRLRVTCGMSGTEAPDQDGGADCAEGE